MTSLPPSIRSIDERTEHELALIQRLTSSTQQAPAANAEECKVASIPKVVQEALTGMVNDPGAIFESSVIQAIKAIRATDHATYVRIRAKVKDAKAGVGELDRLTAARHDKNSDDDMFLHVEPWPESVDSGELIRDVCRTIQAHVIADKPTILAAALWSMHTWCMDVLTISPLAHITAPEKRCGKTVLLTALSRLAYRPLPVSNISPAALFRSIDMWQPTLLIDEADTFLKENDEARGIINSGIYKETAFVIRVEGDAHIPTQFRTWGAKVVCGIGRMADTIEDRSIPLRLRRKVAGESVVTIRHSDTAMWERLRSRMARWADDNRNAVLVVRPEPVLGLNDRAQDCWEPLLAMADLAGETWASAARSAARALHGIGEEAPSINAELLSDIRGVFEQRQASRLTTALLLDCLIGDEEAPWATWHKGRPMSPRQLSARLKEFGIRSKNMRTSDGVVKGYELHDFTDAFARYLSVEHPSPSTTPLQPHNSAGLGANGPEGVIRYNEDHQLHATAACSGSGCAKEEAETVAYADAPQIAPLGHCSGVADNTPLQAKRKAGQSGRASEYESHGFEPAANPVAVQAVPCSPVRAMACMWKPARVRHPRNCWRPYEPTKPHCWESYLRVILKLRRRQKRTQGHDEKTGQEVEHRKEGHSPREAGRQSAGKS